MMKHTWLFPPVVLGLHWWTEWFTYVVVFNLGLCYLLFRYCYSVFVFKIIEKPMRDVLVLDQVAGEDYPTLKFLSMSIYYCLVVTYLASHEMLWTLAHTLVVYLAGCLMVYSILNFPIPRLGVQEKRELYVPEEE